MTYMKQTKTWEACSGVRPAQINHIFLRVVSLLTLRSDTSRIIYSAQTLRRRLCDRALIFLIWFLFSTACEQCWLYHSSGNRWNRSPGTHPPHTNTPDKGQTKESIIFRFNVESPSYCPRRKSPDRAVVLLLMAPSRRWLFQLPDEMKKPWQASRKSLAINPRLRRVLCPARSSEGIALACPCGLWAVPAVCGSGPEDGGASLPVRAWVCFK